MRFVKFKPEFGLIKRIIPLGFGDFIAEIGIGLIVFFYNIFLINYIGEDSIATFSVISYVNQVVCMCFVGITQGIQPLVSYYYGSDDHESYKKLFKYSFLTIAGVSIASIIIVFLFGKNIFLMFFEVSDSALIDYSIVAIRKFSTSFLFVGFNILIAGFSSSLLKANYSIIINICRSFLFILASLFMTSNLLGPNYIWFSSILSEGLCLIISVVLLLRIFSSVYRK